MIRGDTNHGNEAIVSNNFETMKNIGRRVAEKYLMTQARANKHPRKITLFNQIKTIGILYDATLEERIAEVKHISKKLKAMGKEIYTLGFIDKKYCLLIWSRIPKKIITAVRIYIGINCP